MTWFDKSDSMKTVKDHIGGRHTPDSIREDAKREYRERRKEEGASEDEIRRAPRPRLVAEVSRKTHPGDGTDSGKKEK